MDKVDYSELLRHFEGQRTIRQQEFKKEMEGLEETISGLRKMLANQQPLLPLRPRVITNPQYAGMSVRWAILNLLAEDSDGPMPTSMIAEALTVGGVTSSSQNFTSNVSAVISVMTNTRHELESTASGHRLTEGGKRAWEAIKHTHQYINRVSPSASALPS